MTTALQPSTQPRSSGASTSKASIDTKSAVEDYEESKRAKTAKILPVRRQTRKGKEKKLE
jgi:hypothetical protein